MSKKRLRELLAELPAYKVRPADDHPPHRWETGTASFETINGTAAAIALRVICNN